jgi:hypothetical protein
MRKGWMIANGTLAKNSTSSTIQSKTIMAHQRGAKRPVGKVSRKTASVG